MKSYTLVILALVASICLSACSSTGSGDDPIDRFAQTAQQGAAIVEKAAEDAALLGIPGAGIVALIAAAVGSVLGAFNERRRGTTPLTSAITQIVRSVEAAFPAKTESQKTVMSAMQDKHTRSLVSEIKEN